MIAPLIPEQLSAHERINADSGNFEYYTPANITLAARAVMGAIDLDPASSAVANLNVKAAKFYTDRGLEQPWAGRVWMNHPFSKEHNADWIAKLVSEYESGNVTEACCICYASTSEKWFRPLLAYPQCFIHKRTNHLLPDGTVKKGCTKGSVVTYLGERVENFAAVFELIGTVKVPFVWRAN
jgi:hypothetical protein